jgi:hypothetical protein
MLGIRHPAGFCHFQIHLARQLHFTRVLTKSSSAFFQCRRQTAGCLFAAVPKAAAFFRSARMKLSAQGAEAEKI